MKSVPNAEFAPEVPRLEERFANPGIEIQTEYKKLAQKATEDYGQALKPGISPQEKITHILNYAASLQEIDKHIEKFDSTGAYNVEVFHRDLADYMGQRGYKLDSKNHLEKVPSDENTIFLAVSVNNLPVVNAEGGHKAGDDVLAEAVLSAEGIFTSAGFSVEDFRTYHIKGSDFIIRVAGEEAWSLAKNIEKVKKNIASSSLVSSRVLGLTYPSKMVVQEISRSQAIDTFNRVQDELAEPCLAGELGDEKKVVKFLSGIMLNTLEVSREYAILDSLMERVMDDVEKSVSGLGKSKELLERSSQFYNAYLKRFFVDTPFDEFGKLVANLPQKMADLREEVRGAVFEISHRKVFSGWKSEGIIDEVISSIAFSEVERQTEKHASSKLNLPVGAKRAVFGEKISQLAKEEIELVGSEAKEITLEEAQKLYVTEQKKNMLSLQSSHDSFLKLVEDPRQVSDAVHGLADEIRKQHIPSRQFVSIGTKGNYLPDLVDVTLGLYSDKEADSQFVSQQLQTIKKIYSDVMESYKLKYDSLTGLIKREEFYNRARPMVLRALVGDMEASITFMDLGLLRYTNDKGGRKSGDVAINMAAVAMEKGNLAVQELGGFVSIEISRYAGDEFVALVSSEKGSATNLFLETMDKAAKVHKIPRSREAEDDFLPHELQIGVGTCTIGVGLEAMKKVITTPGAVSREDAKRLQKVLNNLERYQNGELEVDEDMEFFSDFLTPLMVRIADKRVEYDKSYKRFGFLYEMYSNLVSHPQLSEDTSVEWKKFKTLLYYSEKALKDSGREIFEEAYGEIGNRKVEKEDFVRYFAPAWRGGFEDENIMYSKVVEDAVSDVVRERKLIG